MVGAEVENLFLSISSCTCISVFALVNGHVDLVTGSMSLQHTEVELYSGKRRLRISFYIVNAYYWVKVRFSVPNPYDKYRP